MVDLGKLFKKQDAPPAPAPIIKKKVLVVEDEVEILTIYQQLLTEGGFDVSVATNGQEGLRKITEVAPNLIFLDIRMPIMDGKTMLSHLRNDAQYMAFKNTPVVMLTNSGTSDNIRETETLGGANEFIIKSNIAPDEIVTIANRYLH